MVTLREAFNLCDIRDDEVVYFCDGKENVWRWSTPILGGEVRKKYDMRNTMVLSIMPHFSSEEYAGLAFVIQKRQVRHG